MAEFADFLNQEEKTRIEGGVAATRRALALSRTIELIETLGRTDLINEQFVDGLRAGIETLDPKQVKALGKGSVYSAQLLAEIITAPPIAADSVEEPVMVVEVPQPAVVDTVPVAVVAPEQAQAPEVEVSSDALLPAVIKYLEGTVGDVSDLDLTIHDAALIAQVLTELHGPMRRVAANSFNYAQVLTDRFSNMPASDIAARIGPKTTVSNLNLSLKTYQKATLDKSTDIDLGNVFRARIEALRQPTTEPTVSVEPAEEYVAVEEKEQTFLSVASEWAERLELDRQHEGALKEFLNPNASQHMTPTKEAAVQALIAYITKHFTSINNEALDLEPSDLHLLRYMSGAWYEKVNGTSHSRPAKPLSMVIDKLRSSKKPEFVEQTIVDALAKILTVEVPKEGSEPAQLEVAPVAPRPQAPTHQIEYVRPPEAKPKTNAEISKIITELSRGTRLSHTEWRIQIGELIQQQARNLGTTEDEAAALWRVLQFGETVPKFDDENRRAVITLLQDRIAAVDVKLFTSKKQTLKGLKILTAPSFTLTTLNDVAVEFAKSNPNVTNESIERDIARGVGILLK